MKELFLVNIEKENECVTFISRNTKLTLDYGINVALALTLMSKNARKQFLKTGECKCYLKLSDLKFYFNEWDFSKP